ncbi:S1/P1 nuclease [Flavobacterium seoulense]|uniref:S1/P1 Nuclease n=1 Tax=Flavobacterium seoulense TaxID=1492738 RepID=A0A066WRQ7_9FLAO|nr:S1/P1 nuclease [Flavobacterium seoulense]KDN56747.1 S1/P1 Nuclease [Flavobacterium seoulense]
MKKLLLLAIISLNFTVYSSPNWGKTGHRTVGEIASNYVSNKTLKKINTLLDNTTIATVSVYADDIKSDKQYDKYGTWHYVNFVGNKKYKEDPINPEGDILQGIKTCILNIRSKTTTKEEKAFALKMLIHFMGDLHMPLHVGNTADKGGNTISVKWFGQNSNLHRVWDSDMIDDYQMSYTELSENNSSLSKTQIEEIEKGNLLDWIYESRQLALSIYDGVQADEKLGYKYSYENFPTVQKQLQKGGVRLALVLNEVFKSKSKWIDAFLANV